MDVKKIYHNFWYHDLKMRILLDFIIFVLHLSPIQCPASVSLSDVNFNSIFHQGLMLDQQQGPVSLVHSSFFYTTKHRSDIKTDQISNISPIHTSVQSIDKSKSIIGFDEGSVYSLSSATRKDGVVTTVNVNNNIDTAVSLDSSTTKMALTSSMSLQLQPSPLEFQTTVEATTTTTNIQRTVGLSSVPDTSAFCSLSPSLSYFYVSSFLHVNCSVISSNDTDPLFTSSSMEYTSVDSSLLLIRPTESQTVEPSSFSDNNATNELSTPVPKLCSHWGPVETSSTVYVKVCPTTIQSSSSVFITPSPCFKLINISSVETRYRMEQCSKVDKADVKSNLTDDTNGNLKNKTMIKITGSMDLKVTSMCSSKFLTTITKQMNVSCGYSMEWSIPRLTNTVSHTVNRSGIEATPSVNTTDIFRTCSYAINASDCLNASHVFKPPNQTSSVIIQIEYEYLEEDRELTGAIILVTTFMLQIFSFAAVVALTAREKIKTVNTVLHWSEKPADESMTTEV